MSRLHSFLAACLETRYSVERDGHTTLFLEIGVRNKAVDGVLEELEARQFVYLTASNPQSTSLSAEENNRRHDELCARVRSRGHSFLLGWATPVAGAWEAEACLFVPGMSHQEALEHCAFFHQDGAVVGAFGVAPRLLFTDAKLRKDLQKIVDHCVLE